MELKQISRGEKILKALKNYFFKTEIFLLLLAVAASAYSLVLLTSVGTRKELIVQLVAVILGICAYFLLSLFDIAHLSSLWKYVFFINLILLSSTLFFGTGYAETGNNSWIRFDIGGTNVGFQPGEIGKILFIFTLAKHFQVLGDDVNTFRGLVSLLAHGLIPTAFVYLFSKDDGMAASYLFIFIIMAFAGGIYLRYCAAGLLTVAASIPFLWAFVFGDYQRDRFIVLFDDTYKLDSTGYHQHQSLMAIKSGGFWGDGLGQGSITHGDYLPAKETDFIFSVACEELGFFGGASIIALLAAIVGICTSFAIRMKDDKFSMLVCVGVASMFSFQTFINVGMNLKLAPVVGLTLPFISYGGTSVVTMYVALGIVASVKRHYIKRSFTRSQRDD
jgi:rod shape determining protein RodA